MLEDLSVGGQTVRFDREATLNMYRALPADQCDCSGCRNFAAQRENIYPQEFARFLGVLGVDPTKEREVFDLDCDLSHPDKLTLYGGWFLFVGELIGGGKVELKPVEDFAYCFTSHFPMTTLLKDVKLCAVEFLVKIPWILPEPPDS
jgi:hypothetical protein